MGDAQIAEQADHRGVRYLRDLPECCSTTPLRVPRPSSASYQVQGGTALSEPWEEGLDTWWLSVGITWWEEDQDALRAAVEQHVGGTAADFPNTIDALVAHGINLDHEGTAWVGTSQFVVGNLGSTLNKAAGRSILWTGRDVWFSADAAAGDLEHLVAPLVSQADDDERWSAEIEDKWPDAEMASAVILLRSVSITPVLRGYGLGAWAAAQSIALFDQSQSLVATLAAPLSREDAVPGLGDDSRELTPEEQMLWNNEQRRLAHYWEATLGLTPLTSDPNVLVWYTAFVNPTIEETLATWA